MKYPKLTITFLIEYEHKFLLILRPSNEENFPSLWAFPGGKPEIGETVVDTIKREVMEETGLELEEEIAFLDTYTFGTSIGLAYLVRAKNNSVKISSEVLDYRWISNLEELEKYRCIPGIYNHYVLATKKLSSNQFDTFDNIQLTEDKYLNK